MTTLSAEKIVDQVLNGPRKLDGSQVLAKIIVNALWRHGYICDESNDAKGLVAAVIDGPRRGAPSRHMSKAITKALRKHNHMVVDQSDILLPKPMTNIILARYLIDAIEQGQVGRDEPVMINGEEIVSATVIDNRVVLTTGMEFDRG